MTKLHHITTKRQHIMIIDHIRKLSLVLICRRHTCDIVAGCNRQCSAIYPSQAPVYLRCAMCRRRTQKGAKCKPNWRTFNRFICQNGSFPVAEVPVFVCFHSCNEVYKTEEDGEEENSKKVLGAANASRANKSRSISYFVRRVATP